MKSFLKVTLSIVAFAAIGQAQASDCVNEVMVNAKSAAIKATLASEVANSSIRISKIECANEASCTTEVILKSKSSSQETIRSVASKILNSQTCEVASELLVD